MSVRGSLPNLKTCRTKSARPGVKHIYLVSLAFSVLLFNQSSVVYGQSTSTDNNQVIEINNEGVKALNAGNTQLALQKFAQALKADPNYQLARDNLAIAHNNYGLQLQNNPKAAIKEFHQALYLNPGGTVSTISIPGKIADEVL